jgi:hypothetical protein
LVRYELTVIGCPFVITTLLNSTVKLITPSVFVTFDTRGEVWLCDEVDDSIVAAVMSIVLESPA